MTRPSTELPLGKRTRQYRFFEMVPAIISWGSIILLIVLAIVSPLLSAVYLLLVIITMIVKAVGIAYHTIRGNRRMKQAMQVSWAERLQELENPAEHIASAALSAPSSDAMRYGASEHQQVLEAMLERPDAYPRPSELYHAVIVAMYNESYDILGPTLQSLVNTTYDKDRMIIVIAYEERGGEAAQAVVDKIIENYSGQFYALHAVRHPKGLAGEIIGKGGNINFAGRHLRDWLPQQEIAYENVIVTTLDSDNKPFPSYFDYVAYEYVANTNRKHLSYQPISLFMNNIWDVPAPMRVVATGNSFWNIISSMRPHTLRNFASHSQPMSALVEMDFWSARSIVEDGHQYWRSYFHFKGDYSVHPIYVPIYQDAVMSDTYVKTLKAQFIQLRRWAYGASDVPYVASHVFTRYRQVPLIAGIARFFRLLDGHVTLASVSLLVAVGAWIPLLINPEAFRDPVAHQLPEVVSVIQRVAMIGLAITVFLSFKMLPPRPERYKRHRSVMMILQWALMPLTAIGYSSLSAFYSQTRLLLGKYLDKFDVTDKATVATAAIARRAKKRQK